MIDYVKHPAPADVRMSELEELAGDAILTALDFAFAAGQASTLRGRKGADRYTDAQVALNDASTKMWRAFYAYVEAADTHTR